MTNQKSFPELIEGRVIAIVGPAVAVGDQSAQVEACDTIIRTNHHSRLSPGEDGLGVRTDVAFLNGFNSRLINQQPNLIEGVPWVMLKEAATKVSHPNVVEAKNPFDLANQIPIILNALEPYSPKEVHIFGADLYASGPAGLSPHQKRNCDDLQEEWEGIDKHDQAVQHEWMCAFQDRTGLIKGDSRMVKLLSMSTDELMNRLRDAWRSVSG